MKKLIVDVDGVLLDVHSELEKRLVSSGYKEFTMNRVLTYDFNKSLQKSQVPNWMLESDDGTGYYLNAPRDRIFNELCSSDLFSNADFFEFSIGMLKRMCNLDDLDVTLYTQSFSDEIDRVKKGRLSSKLSMVDFKYIGFVGKEKPVIEDADFVIEDCVDNLAMYPDRCVKFLVSKPYNQRGYNYFDGYDRFYVVPNAGIAMAKIADMLEVRNYECFC